MHPLTRKLLRDAAHLGPQLGAIAMVVAAAVATYVTMYGAYEALISARTRSYAEYRFPHVFAHVKRAPLHLLPVIAALPGVAAAEGRVVADVPLDVPGLAEPATGRIISLGGTLSGLHLRSGRLPDAARSDEVVASEMFCRANGLRTGDTLSAVMNGRWQRLTIVGIGTTPEQLIEVSGSAVFPDHARFGVLWMPRAAAAAAFAMQGAFNDLAISLGAGADEQEVVAALDRLLARYGTTGAFTRADQHSHQFLQSELTQDRVTATVIPAIFLFVAAFLIHMVLSRLIAGQRDQIALLEAFGYGKGTIALHYLGFAVLVVVAGSAAGIPLGVVLGRGLTRMYRDFFNFPSMQFTVDPVGTGIAVAVTAVAAVAAAIVSALRAAAVQPAEGMRGEQPPAYHQGRLEPLHALLPSGARMVLRSMERRPVRALLAAVGIALAVMILVIGRYSFDALDTIVAIHFREAQRDDVTVAFVEPRPPRVRHDLARLPGVRDVETFRAVPARFRSGHRMRQAALIGLDQGSQLRRLVARDRTVVTVPEHGLVLTKRLAERLHVGRGDPVRVETLEGKRLVFEVPLAATVDELVGIAAYVDRRELARLMREGENVSGAYLSAEPQGRAALSAMLKRLPAVSSAAYREATLRSFLETAAKNMAISMTAVIVFACLIAFAVVYNSARIALSERGRDLATLRVLGFTRREVAMLLLGEQGVLTALGVPLGFILGRLVSAWLVRLFDTDEYRLVAAISADTYGFAFLVILAASAVSAAAVWRRIATLDLVEVLKTRE